MGGVNPSGQPDRFFTVFFYPFPKYTSKNGNISTQVYDQPTGGGRLKYTLAGGGNTI